MNAIERFARRVIMTALMGLPAIPIPGVGQGNRWERQVRDATSQASRSFIGRGYEQAGEPRGGALTTAESAGFDIALQAGRSYVLIGVCDEDCAELDLTLSANGYEVDAARSSSNAPIVRVTPRHTMVFRLRVDMSSCLKNPCWYEVTVLGSHQRLR